MGYVICVLAGYLLGCSNMALYFGRWKKIDLRKTGSCNPGTSNVVLTLGWRAGMLTAVHDIGKAVLAVWIARWCFPELPYVTMAAGAACVIGHIYPVFMKFRGGKGLAPFIGLALGLDWRLALAVAVVIALVTVVTDYLVVGTVLTALCVPVVLAILEKSWLPVLFLGPVSLVILWRHRENYPRILNRTEIGLRSALRGDNKKK